MGLILLKNKTENEDGLAPYPTVFIFTNARDERQSEALNNPFGEHRLYLVAFLKISSGER